MRIYPHKENSPTRNVSRKSKKRTGTRMSVDIVTGKDTVLVYFDPRIAVGANTFDEDWQGMHLYVPATVVKYDQSGAISVKLLDGEMFQISSDNVVHVNPQDSLGIDDILKLSAFSEMSLLETLRVRYDHDEIYTFVGPILISINPYKWVEGLYTEETMALYHGKRPVCNDIIT
jgi:hypothetical protein